MDKVEIRLVVPYDTEDVKVVYINGKYFMQGDYYHDKIDEYIEGFVKGLEYNGTKVIRLPTMESQIESWDKFPENYDDLEEY